MLRVALVVGRVERVVVDLGQVPVLDLDPGGPVGGEGGRWMVAGTCARFLVGAASRHPGARRNPGYWVVGLVKTKIFVYGARNSCFGIILGIERKSLF